MATPLQFVLDENGLSMPSRNEFLEWDKSTHKDIYGADIDLDPESPDGQRLGINAQLYADFSDLVKRVFASFDPDQATGVVLDQRCSINGIQRQAGTYTETPVSIVASQAVTLYGLDQSDQDVFTVSDNVGNQWQLLTTQTITTAGTYSYTFRASNPGRIVPTENTITTVVTVVLGISSINNPASYTVLGQDEETDAQLKIRRQKSVSAKSGGFADQLYAALLNLVGMVDAYVHENKGDSADGFGTPAHGIWVITEGNASDEDIALAIYSNRTDGCNMKGAKSYPITQKDGTVMNIFWDETSTQSIYVYMYANSVDGVNAPNIAAILESLPTQYNPGVNKSVDISDLATKVKGIDPNTYITNAGFSTVPGGPYVQKLFPSTPNIQFSITKLNIYILPAILTPSSVSLSKNSTQQFVPYGGSLAGWTYSIIQNQSGSSITSGGVYTSGSTSGTDIIRAIDSDGNSCSSTVVVS